jgi:arginase
VQEAPAASSLLGEVSTCFAALEDLRAWIATRSARELPVVFAGNCHATVATVAAVQDQRPQVLWLDAHADFHTPETTESGFFDGQGLAMLAGDAWRELCVSRLGLQPLDPSDLLLCGARDIDAAEEQRLVFRGVRRLDVRDRDWLGESSRPVYLHLDLDVLHSALGPVNGYGTSPGGARPEDVEALVSALVERRRVCGASFTSCDPAYASAEVAGVARKVLERLK